MIDILGEVASRTMADQMGTQERILILAKDFERISF